LQTGWTPIAQEPRGQLALLATATPSATGFCRGGAREAFAQLGAWWQLRQTLRMRVARVVVRHVRCDPGGVQVKRALEWLEVERNELRRLAACLILTRMADNAPTVFNVHVPGFINTIWFGLRDPKVRSPAIELSLVTAARLAGVSVPGPAVMLAGVSVPSPAVMLAPPAGISAHRPQTHRAQPITYRQRIHHPPPLFSVC
jgi:hypothetical protein